jgi:putative FmdB family regulatory protein
MPIYEFYCSRCHRIYNFLSRSVDTSRSPQCPRCGQPDLARRPSKFAISKGRKEESADAEKMPDVDEGKLMKLMEELGPEAENLSEDDPRQAAHLMRRLFDASGLPVGGGMEEALRRMEAGEDPDKIEEEMGDVLEEDPFASGDAAAKKKALGSLARRILPPSVDSTLYEM